MPRSDDGSLTPDHTLLEWAALFIEASERFGKSFMVVENMKQEIVDAGFVEVEEVRFKVPLGPWPSDPRLKELGKWDLLYCYQGCEGWALYLLTHVMGVCSASNTCPQTMADVGAVESRGGEGSCCEIQRSAERSKATLVLGVVSTRDQPAVINCLIVNTSSLVHGRKPAH